MNTGSLTKIAVLGSAISLLTGFGFGDLTKDIVPEVTKCSGKKCQEQQGIKAATKIIAVGLAAKLIKEMVISFSSTTTSNEDKVIAKYKKKNGTLPNKAKVTLYKSSIQPGDVVHSGKVVLVASKLEAVRSKKSKAIDLKEKITIYDNENHKKVLKSVTKSVNGKNKRSGAFKNEFKFTLPVGMPQGVYPIKSVVLLNNKPVKPIKNSMQLVLNVISPDSYQIVALAN